MRIGINLLYLLPGIVGGTETYAVSLLTAFSKIDKENEYYIFLNQESKKLLLPESSNFHKIYCPLRASYRTIRYIWEQIFLPFQSKHYSLDILHSLGYVSPLICLCPSVVTIPDLNFIALKGIMPIVKQHLLRLFVSLSAKRARHIITISAFSKNQIQKYFRVTQDKISVTLLGPGWNIDIGQSHDWNTVKKHYDLPESYIVAFSSFSPHKNIHRLIRAYTKLENKIIQNLILIGDYLFDNKGELFNQNNNSRIKFLGYIPTTCIYPILNHAQLFVMPSLYEGFGLPILEAQNAGVAVICSNIASLPEVAGEGALLFNPNSEEDISNTIYRCLTTPTIIENLKSKGRENIKRFAWENTAKQTIEVYANIVENKNTYFPG